LGFKLHLLVTDCGDQLNFALSPSNTDARRPMPSLAKHPFGKIFAERLPEFVAPSTRRITQL
jgi:hypothetical protein